MKKNDEILKQIIALFKPFFCALYLVLFGLSIKFYFASEKIFFWFSLSFFLIYNLIIFWFIKNDKKKVVVESALEYRYEIQENIKLNPSYQKQNKIYEVLSLITAVIMLVAIVWYFWK